ncbi:hypothetical protein ACE38V_01985 [Cytobacillus sp. Hz8]|uniref:hypothetical protein n=1 Tax=Cytobacillus sp. Hz8 TaxID=3347168 RepID=UPI0035D70908
MYYARLVQFKLGTGKRQIAEKICKEYDSFNRNLTGFRGNVYFFDDLNGEYHTLNYWDTKQDAENAHEILFPKFTAKLEKYTDEKIVYRIFEVFDTSENSGFFQSHLKL